MRCRLIDGRDQSVDLLRPTLMLGKLKTYHYKRGKCGADRLLSLQPSKQSQARGTNKKSLERCK